jgi:Zn-dependent metalloprotease
MAKRKKILLAKNKEQFINRNIGVIDRVILNRLWKTKRVVHGARAQNAQLPKFLEKPTKDWDIFAKNPKKAANEMDKALDKKFGGNFFAVKEGVTKKLKVHKVFARATGDAFVDYSIPDRKVPIVHESGIKFASLKDQIKRARQNLKKPEAKFRREKDLDFLRRVKVYEKQRGKKI